MKKIIYIYILLLAGACSPEDFGPVENPQDRVGQLNGTWTIEQVMQIDNDAVRKGFPTFAQQQDITDYYAYEEYEIMLNSDGTFMVNAGASPNIIGGLTSGTWNVDNEDYPEQVIFTNSGISSSISIGSFAEMGNGKLLLKKVRYQEKSGKLEPVITYNYSMVKSNEL